jgi:hypothetical protein
VDFEEFNTDVNGWIVYLSCRFQHSGMGACPRRAPAAAPATPARLSARRARSPSDAKHRDVRERPRRD